MDLSDFVRLSQRDHSQWSDRLKDLDDLECANDSSRCKAETSELLGLILTLFPCWPIRDSHMRNKGSCTVQMSS